MINLRVGKVVYSPLSAGNRDLPVKPSDVAALADTAVPDNLRHIALERVREQASAHGLKRDLVAAIAPYTHFPKNAA